MNITQIDGSIIMSAASNTTSHELQKEYDFMAAETITGKLLEASLITVFKKSYHRKHCIPGRSE